MRHVYIYALLDPTTYEPRYIGQSFDPEQRYKQHITIPEKNYKWNWVRSLKAKGLQPILWILQEVEFAQWRETENIWIAEAIMRGWRLTNTKRDNLDEPQKVDNGGKKASNLPSKSSVKKQKTPTLLGMEKAKQPYKPTSQREWREQEFPIHPELEIIQEKVVGYLIEAYNRVYLEPKTGLSQIIETAVNYAYREWVERRTYCDDDMIERGAQLYFRVARNHSTKETQVAYIKAETVTKIDTLGDYLLANKFTIPNLNSPRWKGVYNRKLIIILALNALNETLKSHT